jgi:hypothetical protein
MGRSALFVLTILILCAQGCGKTGSFPGDAKGPESVYMARHITRAHGVSIGREEDSDIQVSQLEDGIISVRFNPKFYESLRPEAFFVLRIDKTEAKFTKEEYISFLGMLHAYLMLSPPENVRS